MKNVNKIAAVQRYECPICHATHPSVSTAESCLRSCQSNSAKMKLEEKKQKNWQKYMDRVRLDAESVDDVRDLIVKYAKEYMNVTIVFTEFRVSFGDVSCTHDAPIGKPTVFSSHNNKDNNPRSYKGWHGSVEGKISGKNPFDSTDKDSASFSDLMSSWGRNGFRGLHTGTGSGGGGRFNYEFRFYLMDFPKMQKKYDELESLRADAEAHGKQVSIQNDKVIADTLSRVKADSEISGLDRQIKENEEAQAKLRAEKERLSKKRDEMVTYHRNEANKLRDTKYGIPKKYEYDKKKLSEYLQIFGGGRY